MYKNINIQKSSTKYKQVERVLLGFITDTFSLIGDL